MPEPTPQPVSSLSPFCSCLRSKKGYFLSAPPRDESELLDGSCHVWCSKTQQAVGADGDLVSPDECRAPRECFVPYP